MTGINQYREMIAVFTAVLLFLTVPLTHIALMRFLKASVKGVKFMIISFIAYGILWHILVFYLNNFKSVSVHEILAGYSTIGFLCLGYMEAFSMLCRGFSLCIIIDIFRKGPLTISQIIENYGNGKGADWMLKKRIGTMESLGMLRLNGDFLEIKGFRGLLVGKMGLFFKKMLKIGTGG